jgi:hypothetical protein
MLGIIGAVTAGAVGARLFDRPGSAAKQKDEALLARLDALEAAASESSARVLDLEQRARRKPPIGAAAGGPPGERPASSTDVQTHDIQGVRDLGEEYQARFSAEAVDRSWAASKEQEYRGPIESHLPKSSRIRSLECRSKFCRLEVVHESIESSNDFLQKLFDLQPPGPLAGVGFRAASPVPTQDGKLDYVVYIAREGVPVALED